MRQFHSKVAGCFHLNKDGSRRSAILAGCEVGDHLYPQREPDNPFAAPGTIAVALFTGAGKQVGYLPSGVARRTEDLTQWTITVASFYNYAGRGSRGATLLVTIQDQKDETKVEPQPDPPKHTKEKGWLRTIFGF